METTSQNEVRGSMNKSTARPDISVGARNRLPIKTVNPVYPALFKATAIALAYVILIFLLPTSKTSLGSNLSNFDYKVIRFAVSLPTMLVWVAAYIGYAVLREYASTLTSEGTKEGQHFSRLAQGSAWLAWSLPVMAISELVLSSLAYEWHGFTATSVIIGNYINLIMPLIAFSWVGSASRGLISSIRIRLSLTSARMIVGAFLTMGVLYCYLTFRHFNLTQLGSTDNPYHLPIWLMALTIIIPYLYVWFIGLLAAYEISLYTRRIAGLIYRRALRMLVGGIVLIILSSIAIEYLSGVEPQYGHLVLNGWLVIGVLFRVLSGLGFILLALGALRLKKIEEV